MIIDVHAHIIVPEITRASAPQESWRPEVVWEGGRQFVDYGGKRISSPRREFVRVDQILEAMDWAGVEGVLLSPWASLTRYSAPPADSLMSAQIQNDALAALRARHPNRIAALGTVPLQDVPLAIRELERLMGAGLKGVEVGIPINGVYPGEAGLRPFWEACQALEALIFIHPLEGAGRVELRDFYLWNVVGNPFETTIAAAHLILSGVMESYPALKVLLAHGGGAAAALRGRLDRGFRMRPEIQAVIPHPPSEYLKRFYFDTITHDAALLRDLVAYVGADHVLLGSDYPFDMGDEHPADTVRAAGLDPEAERLVSGGNAARLLGWAD